MKKMASPVVRDGCIHQRESKISQGCDSKKFSNFLVQERECTRVTFGTMMKHNEECVGQEISWLIMAEALDLPGVARAAETTLAKYAFNLSQHPRIHEVSRESLLRLLDMRNPS